MRFAGDEALARGRWCIRCAVRYRGGSGEPRTGDGGFQGAVTVVIKWIIAIVLIALAGLVARPWVSRLFNRTEIFNVCQGPEKAGCAGSPHFISCETDVVEWLKSIRPDVCTKVEAKKLTTAPANTCGYTKYEVKCSRR